MTVLKDIAVLMPWIVILILGLVYARPIVGLLNRIIRAKFSKDGVELEAQRQLVRIASQSEVIAVQSESVAHILVEINRQIEKIAQQEKPYADHSEALKDAEQCIIDCLVNRMKRQESSLSRNEIFIKVIAVSMTFSWTFIRDKITKILKEYPGPCVTIELAFVDYQYLQSRDLEDFDINWAGESKQRVKDIDSFVHGLSEQLSERLCIVARIYQNLPHWHGLLIDDEYLFLGRTDWSFLTDKPKLTAGQNKYRYFDDSSSAGRERIELFKNWHMYYFQSGLELPSHQLVEIKLES